MTEIDERRIHSASGRANHKIGAECGVQFLKSKKFFGSVGTLPSRKNHSPVAIHYSLSFLASADVFRARPKVGAI
jgi:hypothetical protein